MLQTSPSVNIPLEQIEEDVQSSNGIRGTLLERLANQTRCLLDVLELHTITESHPSVRFGKTDHAL